jgi:hypothetical protein
MTDGNYIHAKINGKNVRILVDTGANPNVMDFDLAKQLHIQIKPLRQQFSLFTAIAGRMPVMGMAYFNISCQSELFPTEAYVVQNLSDKMLLGRKFLQTYNCTINYMDNSFTIDYLTHTVLQNNHSRVSAIRSITDVEILPQSAAIVNVRVHSAMTHKDVMIKETPGKQFKKFGMRRFLIHPQTNVIPCRILNFRPEKLVIYKNEIVGQAVTVHPNECFPLHDKTQSEEYNNYLKDGRLRVNAVGAEFDK